MTDINNMTAEQLRAALAEANAKVARMQQAAQRKLTLKVSEKGAISLYGMGKFPVTLYAEQWERVIGMGDEIKTFIADNRAALKFKDAQ